MTQTQIYQDNLQEGKEFEDYCYRWLEVHKRTRITPCEGKDLQIKVGENYFGLEIKLDKMFRTTQRLYIEIKERSHTRYAYTDSGIFRKDNSFLYAVGDRETLYVFDKKRLKAFYEYVKSKIDKGEHGGHRIVENGLKTSYGWLLPIQEVVRHQLAADIWQLCPVSIDEINRARGFGTFPVSTQGRRHKAKPEGQLNLFQPSSQQLDLI